MSAQGRGPYLTESRTLALEQRITALEARQNARLDELEQRVAAQVFADVISALAHGLALELRALHGRSNANGSRAA